MEWGLEQYSLELRERNIGGHYNGYLMAADTFFVDYLRDVGRVGLQSAINCRSRFT